MLTRLNVIFQTELPTWVVSDYPTPREILAQLIAAQPNFNKNIVGAWNYLYKVR